MTDWRSLRGSNFLAPEDLEEAPCLITIVAVKGEEMLDDDEKIKKEIAITFKGRQRNPRTGQVEDLTKTEWVANVINCELLEALFGTPHYEEWAGRRAMLQQEPCEVPGKYLDKPSVRVAGGPDLERDLPVEIVLKMKGGRKRKPIHKVLRPTRGSASAANVDPDTGEVLPVATKVAGNGTITEDEVEEIRAVLVEKGRAETSIVAVLNSKGLCAGGLETMPQAKFASVIATLREIPVVERPGTPAAEPETDSDPIVSASDFDDTAPEAPQDAPGDADEPEGDLDPEDGDFLAQTDMPLADQAAANGKETKPKSEPGVTGPQLTRLGALGTGLEGAGIDWRQIMVASCDGVKSRKELSKKQATTLIRTLETMERAVPKAKAAGA